MARWSNFVYLDIHYCLYNVSVLMSMYNACKYNRSIKKTGISILKFVSFFYRELSENRKKDILGGTCRKIKLYFILIIKHVFKFN